MAKEIRNQVIDGRLVDGSYPNENANYTAVVLESRWLRFKKFMAQLFGQR